MFTILHPKFSCTKSIQSHYKLVLSSIQAISDLVTNFITLFIYFIIIDFITNYLIIIIYTNNIINGHTHLYFGPSAGLILFLKIISGRMSSINILESLVMHQSFGCANPWESDMQIRKSLKGDDYFKWYRPLTAIVENLGECAIPFGDPRDTVHSKL